MSPRSALRRACALGLCFISKASATGAECYFVAANGMACYEATNETALKLTLQAYASSPWRGIYQGSVVKQGSCKDTEYNIPTKDSEECIVSNISLTVYLDRNLVNNGRWAESEYLLAKEFAERQGLELWTVLSKLQSICKKPILANPSISVLSGSHASAGPPFHWELGKTALPDPRGVGWNLDEELPAVSEDEAVRMAKHLKDEADRAAEDAAQAQQAAATAWKSAWPSIATAKHFEPAHPHVAEQSSVESGQTSKELPATKNSGEMKRVARKVDRLERKLRNLRDLLKSLEHGIEKTSPPRVEAAEETSPPKGEAPAEETSPPRVEAPAEETSPPRVEAPAEEISPPEDELPTANMLRGSARHILSGSARLPPE